MVQLAEQETIPATIEATVNYVLDNGDKLFTQTGGPGSTDVRVGGRQDPHQVVIRNARVDGDRFVLDRDGFRFVRHDTKIKDFFDEDEIRRVRVPIALHPTDEDTLHLVRPDGYIAFRSCPADLSALSAYLDKAFN